MEDLEEKRKPLVVPTSLGIILFIAAIWPAFVAHEMISDCLARKGWLVPRPPWHYVFALTLGVVMVGLQIALIRAVLGSKKEKSAATKDVHGLFEIEYINRKFFWRTKAEQGCSLVIRNTPIPHDATLVLAITTRITATPPVQVEDIWLAIEGRTRPERLHGDWTPQNITTEEQEVRFVIPPSLPSGLYSAKLVARVSQDDPQTSLRTSRSFNVYISRLLAELLR